MKSGWFKKYADDLRQGGNKNIILLDNLVQIFLFPSRYYGWNKTTQNNMSLAHFPGWSEEAVEFLATKRDIVGIAVDTIELDPGIELSTFKVS